MILIALLLIVEGLSTGLWIARVVPMLSVLGALVIGLMLARGLIGAMQLAGGVFLLGRRPAAVTLSQWALIGSATLTTFEIGERLVPTNLVPSLRWPLVGAYWVYALGASVYLRSWEAREILGVGGRVEMARAVSDRGVWAEPRRELPVDWAMGRADDPQGPGPADLPDTRTRPRDPADDVDRAEPFD